MMKLSSHLENSIFFHVGDYLNFEKMADGVRTSFNFVRTPGIYCSNGESYFAAEIKIEGLKIITAALAADDILNIRLEELDNPSTIRNINFCIPTEANARMVSVEVFGGQTIQIRAPIPKNALK